MHDACLDQTDQLAENNQHGKDMRYLKVKAFRLSLLIWIRINNNFKLFEEERGRVGGREMNREMEGESERER